MRVAGGGYPFVAWLSRLPSTTHPCRDGAQFLLLVETPPTFWALSTFVPYIAYIFLLGGWGGGLEGAR